MGERKDGAETGARSAVDLRYAESVPWRPRAHQRPNIPLAAPHAAF